MVRRTRIRQQKQEQALLQTCLGKEYKALSIHLAKLYIYNSALLNNRDEEDNKPEERKKLNLKPRTVAESSSTEKKEEKLADDVVKSRSKNILEEYFSIRDKKVNIIVHILENILFTIMLAFSIKRNCLNVSRNWMMCIIVKSLLEKYWLSLKRRPVM
jgi:hypothetical protein